MPEQKVPDLIRLYIKSCAIGFVLSAIFVGLLIGFDVMGLGGLIARSDVGPLAILMIWFFNGVVFASVQFAIAIMGMADDDDDDEPRGGLSVPVLWAKPVAVRATEPAGKRKLH